MIEGTLSIRLYTAGWCWCKGGALSKVPQTDTCIMPGIVRWFTCMCRSSGDACACRESGGGFWASVPLCAQAATDGRGEDGAPHCHAPSAHPWRQRAGRGWLCQVLLLLLLASSISVHHARPVLLQCRQLRRQLPFPDYHPPGVCACNQCLQVLHPCRPKHADHLVTCPELPGYHSVFPGRPSAEYDDFNLYNKSLGSPKGAG